MDRIDQGNLPDDRSSDAIDAGEFGRWLTEIEAAIAGSGETDVACGSCVGCCSSSQFIHIEPDETDALAHIPQALLFPAPQLPPGNVLLGYDKRGRCPMLRGNGCSIYEHRPRTCRTYDCRVFVAAGLDLDEPDKQLIAERARRWEFSYADESGRVRHAAVRSAARFLDAHRHDLPRGAVPLSATPLSVLAIGVHRIFLGTTNGPHSGDASQTEPTVEEVRVELVRRRGREPVE